MHWHVLTRMRMPRQVLAAAACIWAMQACRTSAAWSDGRGVGPPELLLAGVGVHVGAPASADGRRRPACKRGTSACRGALRLRGGADEADEYRTPFEKLDGMMTATLGKTIWGVLKALVGWRDRPRASPSRDLHELQQQAEARKRRVEVIDRKLWYFFSKGPVYALNPLTHVSRFLAGTEKSVKAAVLFVNAERATLSVPELRGKLMAPKSKGGMGLTRKRVEEAFYRAALEYSPEDMEASVVQSTFAEEDDEELEEFKKKALQAAAKKGGGNAGGAAKTLHAAATKKWTGSSGNVVKRLQKELIGIQSTGSFQVELVKDDIFHWWVTIEGAKGSFYEDEKFKLSFKFDSKYPTEPPEVTFVAKVPGWPMPDAPTTNSSGLCPSQRGGQEWPSRWGKRAHHCPIHPHIYTNGNICLSIIYDDWSPALGVEAVCHSMVSMLSSAKEKNPPADNEMHLDAAGGKSAKEIKGWDFHDNEA